MSTSSTRATTYGMALQSVQDLNTNLVRLQQTQRVVSSTLKVNDPSDDPAAAARGLRLTSSIKGVEAQTQSINQGVSRLNAASTALSSAVTLAGKAQTIALRGLNDLTMDDSSRTALAEEVDQQLQQMMSLANTTQDGQSVFGGWQTQGQAYTSVSSSGSVTSVSYAGDAGVVEAPGGQGGGVQTNLPGSQVFSKSGADVFDALVGIRDALRNNDTAALNSYYGELQSGQKQLSTASAQIGSYSSSASLQLSQLSAAKTQLTSLYSKTMDADMTQAATDYQNALTVYQAGLSAASSIMQLGTLASYLH